MIESGIERRLEDLEQRVRVLESGLSGMFDPLCARFSMSFTLAQILALLLKRDQCRTQTLYDLIYGGADDAPDFNTIRVQVHHLRQKLKPFGIKISNGWHGGYSIHPHDKIKIRQLIANVSALESVGSSEPAAGTSRTAAGSLLRGEKEHGSVSVDGSRSHSPARAL